MTLEDTYPLPKPHKRRVSAYLRSANSNDTRGGQDFSVSYILKARNIRGHIKIQHVMHKLVK